ncbi:MAG: ATP-binding protein [Thermoanaerobacteraceae bacterium]|nr:ATP-binding protein [Thermoanaerobacteraceae bacterium]
MAKISILSGKGGTGKTFASTNLVRVLPNATYIDCDIEEPNGRIFLNPIIEDISDVYTKVPLIDDNRCERCGICSKVCRFGALINLGREILILDHLCHSCEACYEMCPMNAITMANRKIGEISTGVSRGIDFIEGRLNPGEPSGVPIIKQINILIKSIELSIVDSPPGTSCSVVNTIEDSDLCILVTEPTPFGLHDLKLAVELVKEMDIPMAVIINKSGSDNQIIYNYCMKNDIKVLMEIPYDKKIAELYSRGTLIAEADSTYEKMFVDLAEKILELIENEAAGNSEW